MLTQLLRRGMPVFTVPGVYLILPSRRGKVRCTPLFLSKQHVDRVASFVRDFAIHTVRRLIYSSSYILIVNRLTLT